jgi:hypothetical protein
LSGTENLLQSRLSQEALAAALRARSLALRGALAARVLIWVSRLLSCFSLRFPITISFQYFYQICHAVPDFIANKAFSVLLQPAYTTYSRIVRRRHGKSNELFGEIEYELNPGVGGLGFFSTLRPQIFVK